MIRRGLLDALNGPRRFAGPPGRFAGPLRGGETASLNERNRGCTEWAKLRSSSQIRGSSKLRWIRRINAKPLQRAIFGVAFGGIRSYSVTSSLLLTPFAGHLGSSPPISALSSPLYRSFKRSPAGSSLTAHIHPSPGSPHLSSAHSFVCPAPSLPHPSLNPPPPSPPLHPSPPPLLHQPPLHSPLPPTPLHSSSPSISFTHPPLAHSPVHPSALHPPFFRSPPVAPSLDPPFSFGPSFSPSASPTLTSNSEEPCSSASRDPAPPARLPGKSSATTQVRPGPSWPALHPVVPRHDLAVGRSPASS